MTITNLTLTNADTEYSTTLTGIATEVSFQCRTAFAVRFASVTGKVAGSTSPFATLKSGQAFSFSRADGIDQTLYFASSEAGVVVEITQGANP